MLLVYLEAVPHYDATQNGPLLGRVILWPRHTAPYLFPSGRVGWREAVRNPAVEPVRGSITYRAVRASDPDTLSGDGQFLFVTEREESRKRGKDWGGLPKLADVIYSPTKATSVTLAE